MRRDDLARDREAKASAANVAVSEAFHAVERVEDVVQRLARNPDAVVLNAHLEAALRCVARRDGDLPTPWAVLARVREQIAEHLLDAVGLGHGHRQVLGYVEGDRVLGVVRGQVGCEMEQ